MDTATVDNGGGAADVDTVLAPSAGNYGSAGAAGISWSDNTTLVATLGAGMTVASGATVNPTDAVTDAAGNADATGAGVTITDDVGPTLDSIAWSDEDSSGTISATDTLTFNFSEPMDTATVDNGGGAADVDTVLAPSAGNYGSAGAAGISWSDNTTLVVTLGAGMTVASGATVNPTDAVTDAAGNADATGAGVTITDNVGPTLDSISWNDIDGSTAISATDTLVFTFSEAMDTSTVTVSNINTVLDSSASGTIDYGDTITSVVWSGENTICTVTLTAGTDIVSGATVNPTDAVTDAAGNADATTPPGPAITDNVGPALDSIAWSDEDSSGTIDAADTLTFNFSEPIDTATVDNAGGAADVDTVLAPSAGNYGSAGAAGISWTDNTTLVVTLGAGMTVASGATVNPTDAVTDVAGNADNTTAPGPAITDNVGPTLGSIAWSDEDNSGTISATDTLTFIFSEAMDTSTVDNAGGVSDVDTVLAPSVGNYGTDVSWSNNTTLLVTLGANPTIDIGATVDPTDTVTDAAGNADNTTAPGPAISGTTAAISITYPQTGKTTGLTPTVSGIGPANTSITIKEDGTTHATVTSDSAGNFRTILSTLTEGNHSLVPFNGNIEGSGVTISAINEPTPSETPTITPPTENGQICGATPEITGSCAANETVTLTVNDENGNLLLADVATTTADASGNYTINISDYTTDLPKGKCYLAVEVDGVLSNLITVVFVDPFGVVFDSATNEPIEGAVVRLYYDDDPGPERDWIVAVGGPTPEPGVHFDSTVSTNPQTTAADGFYQYMTIDGDFYLEIVPPTGYVYPSTQAAFPAGRTVTTGSKGEVFTVAGEIIEMDHPVDRSSTLIRLTKEANRSKAVVGDIITYTVTRPLNFNIGTITAGAARTLKYQLVVGSGVGFGEYTNVAQATSSIGLPISNTAREKVTIIPDPLFDLGTVIGKVFHDRNENGVQDKGEELIGGAQIVTEEGTVITTDKKGMYHLEGITPGRHLFKIVMSTVPEGATLTTEEAVIVDVTRGLMRKVNFGLKLPQGQVKAKPFSVTTDTSMPKPRLNVAMLNNKLVIKGNKLEEPAQFRIFTNYQLFINKWKLEVLDKDTGKVIKTFEGTRNDIFKTCRVGCQLQ